MTEKVKSMPEQVCVSLGSAAVLGLSTARLDTPPTTAYLMTYKKGKCTANCSFCPQARGSRSRADLLSRVSWPAFPTQLVLSGLEQTIKDGAIKRVCMQALNYPDVFTHISALVRVINRHVNVPISVSCQPRNARDMKQLAAAGVERIGIPLDAATEEIFERVKGQFTGGPYRWKGQFRLLTEAVGIFGERMVSTHLIVGLGETEKQMISIIQKCVDTGVLPSLFAFTPVPGTLLEGLSQPQITRYRRIQTARYLMLRGTGVFKDMRFDEEGCLTDFGIDNETLLSVVQTGDPFLTSGCPSCNRPYYNERPSGPIYNYARKLTQSELSSIIKQLNPS